MLLGPAGMGISGLILSTNDTVKSIVGCGLDTSAVKSISSSKENVSSTIATLRRLVWITGLLGFTATFFLSPWLSNIAFGNNDYTLTFRIVSVTLLLGQITVGQTALLQGTFHYKDMAKSTFYGSLVGLILTIPLYYVWGIKAIPFVIVVASVLELRFSLYYSKKVTFERREMTKDVFKTKSNEMLSLGLSLSVVGIVNALTAYFLKIYISNSGGVEGVGLSNAAYTIANSYVGMVLTSMGTDYIPRLSAASNDIEFIKELINKQISLLLILVLPLVTVFMLFIKPLMILLYSSKFLPIIGMMEWVMIGMVFRTVSWCISYSFVARGDAKVFFVNESITAMYSLLFSVIGYHFLGFEGLGMAFALSYVLYTIQLTALCRHRIGFRMSKKVIVLLFKSIVCAFVIFFICRLIQNTIWKYVIGNSVMIVICFIYYKELSKRMDIKAMLRSIIKKGKDVTK